MIVTLLLATTVLWADPAAWPGFLGAGSSTIDPASIPLKWSPTENVAWDASLPGHGQSSPVVWGDKVFVTTIEGDNKETCHTLCLSLTDGKILWITNILQHRLIPIAFTSAALPRRLWSMPSMSSLSLNAVIS